MDQNCVGHVISCDAWPYIIRKKVKFHVRAMVRVTVLVSVRVRVRVEG